MVRKRDHFDNTVFILGLGQGMEGKQWLWLGFSEGGRQGVSHLQPMCLTGLSVREHIVLCCHDHSHMFVCKGLPEISLP